MKALSGHIVSYTSRDLAIVGLMLLQGLRSKEVIALNCEDVLPSESQMRVHGKGNKVRVLPCKDSESISNEMKALSGLIGSYSALVPPTNARRHPPQNGAFM